jgi:hypothetical protein
MSKQIQSGDEQNLELSESLRAAIEKPAASKQQQAEASKSIEDDSPERARSSGCSIFCRRRLLIEPEVYASAAQKWLPQKLLTMLQLLKEW